MKPKVNTNGFEKIDVYRYCEKRRYLTKAQAKNGASRVGKEHGKELRAYRCPRCRGYHLTSKAK